jgi:hypothetical protein
LYRSSGISGSASCSSNLCHLLVGHERHVGNRRTLDTLVTEDDADFAGAVPLFCQFDDAVFDGVRVDVAPLRWFVCRRLVRIGRATAARMHSCHVYLVGTQTKRGV